MNQPLELDVQEHRKVYPTNPSRVHLGKQTWSRFQSRSTAEEEGSGLGEWGGRFVITFRPDFLCDLGQIIEKVLSFLMHGMG